MRSFTKIISLSAILLLISACTSVEAPEKNEALFATYSESWKHGNKPNVVQLSVDKTINNRFRHNVIANTRLNICDTEDVCYLVPLYVYVNYRVDGVGSDYEVTGEFVTEPIFKRDLRLFKPLHVPFSLNSVSKRTEVVGNDVGAQLALNLTEQPLN